MPPSATRRLELRIGPHGHGHRVDAYLPTAIARLSRSRVKAMLAAGEVLVDGRRVKPSHRLRGGELVAVDLPDPDADKPPLVADDVPLEVVHEDEHVLAVSKPPGMRPIPRHRFEGGSLVNALVTHLGLDPGGKGPRIMHRLDVDTSGVILVAKTAHAAKIIGRQFNYRSIRKEYRALVHGHPERAEDMIELPIAVHPEIREKVVTGRDLPDAQPATTKIRRLERLTDADGRPFAWLAMWPKTGRTHQLRVHAASLGHGMVADPFYGPPTPPGCLLTRQALHAAKITFTHPGTREKMTLEAPVAPDISAELDRLRESTKP